MKLLCVTGGGESNLTTGKIYFGQIIRYEVGGGCAFVTWNDEREWKAYDLERFSPPEVTP